MSFLRRAWSSGGRGRYLVASSVVLGMLVAPLAVQASHQTGQPITTGKRTYVNKETGVIANNAGYSLRFSNKKEGEGGGLVSGCRAAAGKEACIYADNLRDGQAFLFRVRRGSVGGRIEVFGQNAKPFTTNATAVADGLNADRVDSRNVGCAQGTREIDGLCWDESPRTAATVNAASDACHGAGGRLPTPMALRAVRGENGFDLGSAAAGTDEITDSLQATGTGGALQVIAVADDGGTRAVDATEAHPYRCVFDLVRAAS
jgi:hypothetical protein